MEKEQTDRDLSIFATIGGHFSRNPLEFYRILREKDPVHWDPYMHAWVVTSYAEVVRVLMQGSADRSPLPEHLDELGLSFMKPFAEIMQRQMMFADGTRHAHLRELCAAVFTPRRVEALRAMIRVVADVLIEKVLAAGRIEMIRDFAGPLPAIITARLLGVPACDHAKLGAWVNNIAELLGNFRHNPHRIKEIVRSLEQLKTYIETRMVEERRTPTDGLLHSLMTAEAEGKSLNADDIVANIIITLIGGHETTTNLIANGFLTLLRNPASFMQLQRDPEIIVSAVEELLRYESPVQHTARIALSDIELGGKVIRRGSKVVAVLAAANRDPLRFPDPDRLDLLRKDNRHLAFGWGAHFCFGAPLARLEAQIAFNVLLRRLSNPRLGNEQLVWRQNAGLRGLVALPITFAP